MNITFKPERPKSNENFNIVIPDEECLVFDTFNFKLAVVNELMYNQPEHMRIHEPLDSPRLDADDFWKGMGNLRGVEPAIQDGKHNEQACFRH